jgi:hypothetical protein
MTRKPNMRIATTLAAILLLPVSLWSQAQTTTDAGHFAGWLAGAHWGADKQTFDVRSGNRHVEATFTVAANGFGWHQTFTTSEGTFNPWANVTAWCSAPGTVAFRTRQRPSSGVYDLAPEDLVTIVDKYFKKYVPAMEWSGPDWQCTAAALSGRNPADMAKVRELLEAAAEER